MKNWKKIFNIVAALVIIFTLSYTFFLLEAKNILAGKIEQACWRKISIGKLSIKPPFNIEIRDF